ncbi:uncharacterized protein LOC102490660 isoform X2 [Tupaia chinensis]|uniref:uncharacterized protein LOC102490660 isoform X2 n=1 Tax=Tupaia chinensis TaxID=246437 RepID=UPI000FFBA5C7|nr:uncharacterized protein LOC102490660 isoform X2 [Tupaia chinensis]
MPATTSDLYSFCILAQEVFTGKLPWAGREGPEVKAKLEAGESPALDPLVPGLYQALVQAGLGLGPADRRGSLQNARYLLREAMAQDSTPAEWTTLSSAPPGSPPEKLYYEVAPGATSTPGPSVMPPGPLPAQVSLPYCLRMDLLEEIMAELQSGCQLRGKLSPGPSPGLDSHGSLSADTASQNLPETSSQ